MLGKNIARNDMEDMIKAIVRGFDKRKQRMDRANANVVTGRGGKQSGSISYSKSGNKSSLVESAVSAIRTVATTQADVQDAVVRDDIGSVDFVWGDEGAEPSKSGKRKGAKGIAHIIEARMRKDGLSLSEVFQLLDSIAETVAIGQVVNRSVLGGTQKTAISDGKHTAWLVKSGEDNHWLLTGWEDIGASGELSEGHDSSQPTSLKPTPTRLEDGAEAHSESIAKNSTTEQPLQPDIRFSKTAAPTARTAKQKLGLEEEAAQTLKQKITENYRNTADTLKQSSFWSRLNEGIFDGLHGIKKAEEAAGITDPNKMGYVSARLASGLSDVLHGVFHYGAPMWKDGVDAVVGHTRTYLLRVTG